MEQLLRFIGKGDIQVEELPWGPHHWLSRPGFTDAEQLLVVRVHMPPGQGHAFHRHPSMEEVLYVIEGRGEQWIDRESKVIGPGEAAHIPTNVVHGIYNTSEEPLVFLAILSPANAEGPALIDVCHDEPWCSLR